MSAPTAPEFPWSGPCTSAELRDLDPAGLAGLAERIREFLIAKVSATGGHLGPNLGVVELTIALHRVFDSPTDRILFDVGHQAYVHKILTGRHAGFDGLRRSGGLSGYPSQAESAHDVIENSHASTALSYADGLARAYALRGDTARRVVAVVGDGALTGGMAWEALNNIGGAPGRPVVIVLNDNGRSYAPTVGGLARHLGALSRGEGSGATGTTLFDAVGVAYLGPVDGHDIAATEAALRRAAGLGRPVVVHCVTVKGKGYPPAEADLADCLHAVGTIDPVTAAPAASAPTWTDVFASRLCAVGARRGDVVAITAAMPGPTGLSRFGEAFPGRMIDVGISEQHAVTCAAGLALGGLRPVVAIYSTFLNRAFDQVMMDLALHRLPVTLVLDRAGITGPDGPSHHGMWDLAVLSAVPGLRVAAPRDPARLAELLDEAIAHTGGPTVLRFPKATVGPDLPALSRMDGIDLLYRSPGLPLDVLLVAGGAMAGPCLGATAALTERGIGVTVADPRWVLPINPALTHLAARHRMVITVEDALRTSGSGTALRQACSDAGVATAVGNLGLPRAFLAHGNRGELLAGHHLTPEGIAEAVLDGLARLDNSRPARTEGHRR